LREDVITSGHARSILSLEDESRQRELFRKIIEQNMSVRQSEVSARRMKGKRGSKRAPEILDLEEELQKLFGTKVRITGSSKSGRIEIFYYSLEDVERIIKMMRKISGVKR